MISLEEARRIAASNTKVSAPMPPRSIQDVTAVLKLHQPDVARIAALQASADAPVSDGDWRGYRARGHAAASAGRPEQALADLRKSLEAAKDVPPQGGKRSIMRELAIAELESGNYASAIKVMQDALGEMPTSVGNNETLARIYAAAGDVERAKVLAAKVISRQFSPDPKDPPQEWRYPTARYLVLEAEGQWASAETSIRESIAAYKESGMKDKTPNWVEKRQLVLADNVMRQGRLVAAEIIVRDALISIVKSVGKYNLDTAEAVGLFADILRAQGRFSEAEALISAQLEILKTLGVKPESRPWRLAHEVRGRTLAAQGRWAEAAESFDVVRGNTENNKADYIHQKYFARSVDAAIALVKTGHVDQAEQLLTRLVAERVEQYGRDAGLTTEAEAALAFAQSHQGRHADALARYRRQLPSIVRGDAFGNKGGEHRYKRELILDDFLELLSQKINAGTDGSPVNADMLGESFLIGQAAQGGTVSLALAASAARNAANTPELVEIVREQQDIAGRLHAFEQNIVKLVASGDPALHPVIADLQKRIKELLDARQTLTDKIDERMPQYKELASPTPVPVDGVRSLLETGESLVSYYVGRSKTYIWAVPKNGPVAFASVSLSREDGARIVAKLRKSLDSSQFRDDVPDFDLDAAYSMYSTLLQPVRSGWGASQRIVVVGHGPLAQIPLAILPTAPTQPTTDKLAFDHYRNVPWLITTHVVTVVPSVSSLKTLRNLASGKADRNLFAGFGDPVFNTSQLSEPKAVTRSRLVGSRAINFDVRSQPLTRELDSAKLDRVPRLPETADELLQIAKAIGSDPATSVFLREKASRALVRSMSASGQLAKYRVLSFATHGLVPGDLDGLDQPALAMSTPAITGQPSDGLLTLDDILGLRLDADWVVLSACNTAAGDGDGAEAISGLGRGFFYAGTRALLASYWPVESNSTRDLMISLFQAQASRPNASRTVLLQQTILDMIKKRAYLEDGKVIYTYAHPFFWAPFVLVGDGRASVTTRQELSRN